MKRERQDRLTDHHLLPRSRGGQTRGNIKRVPCSYHQAYHKLFCNMTPDEIIEYLEQMWFTKERFITPSEWLKSLGEL